MTTATLTLTSFLLARIAEDEAVAREATPGPWVTVIPHEWATPIEGELLVRTTEGGNYWEALITPAGGEHGDDGLRGPDAVHVARYDPARVLAECEAKRRIVARLVCSERDCSDHDCQIIREDWAILAAVYADHDDYRSEWAI